jgi:uncharacterized protein YqfB (UPF0267 family)
MDRSITCIENLSNECFYEIFDYLDGIDIYEAFSNLNYRFQQLLNSSSLLFKIKSDDSTSEEIFRDNYELILVHNKHQIYSINLWTMENMFLARSLYTINSSCDRLESLVLVGIEPNILRQILTYYTCLPRLFLLNINTECSFTLGEMTDIYQLIFALPKLKSIEFDTDICDDSTSILPLSIGTNQQFSSIKRLYIGHACCFNELFSIISYTPQLCRLKISYAHDDDESPNIKSVSPISLLNLIDFSIDRYEMKLHRFEWFIKNIFCKLKFLYVNIEYGDMTRFDANQWEQLIRQYFPQLKKFYLTYYEYTNSEHKILNNSGQLNQFFSSFWIERQSIVEIEIHDRHIKYIIRPYRYISFIFGYKINKFVCLENNGMNIRKIKWLILLYNLFLEIFSLRNVFLY